MVLLAPKLSYAPTLSRSFKVDGAHSLRLIPCVIPVFHLLNGPAHYAGFGVDRNIIQVFDTVHGLDEFFDVTVCYS